MAPLWLRTTAIANKSTWKPDVSGELESLVEEEEEETRDGPSNADGFSVITVNGPFDAADLHLLVLDQHLSDGHLRFVDLKQ